MQKLGSAAFLAERYDVNVCTIWRWAAAKVLEPIKLSAGCTRFDIEASDKSILSRDIAPKDVTVAVANSVRSPDRHKDGRRGKP